MAGSIFVRPKAVPINAGGVPYSGAKYTFYLTSTSTLASVYTDSALTTPHANPVVADANGVFAPIWLDPAVTYRARLTTSSDVLIEDVDPVGLVVIPADSITADMLAPTAVTASLWTQTGTGAVARTVGSKLGDVYHAADFGVVGDGVTNDATKLGSALTAATGGTLVLPEGSFLITSALTIPADTCLVGQGIGSRIVKGFNGDMVTMGARSQLHDLYLDGAGGTFTGRGVVISTGSLDEVSWRKLVNVSIIGTASYGLEFTAATSGYASQVINCRIVPQVQTTHAVKLPTGETNNGNRMFIGLWTYGCRMIDFGECDNTLMIGCQGAVPTHASNTKKVTMVGCRIVNSGDGSVTTWAINGQQSSYTGNIIACSTVTLASTCASVKWQGNSVSGVTVTDSTTGVTDGNEIDLPQQTYTPTWTSTGTQPAIGNGTLNGAYARRGQHVHTNIRFEPGGTSTYGTGFYRFSLPYTASRRSVGSAYIEDVSGVAVYVGTAMIDSGTSTVYVTTSGSTAAYMGAAVPFTWASGDKCWIDIEYAIQ